MSTLLSEIAKRLPGFNCRACGHAKCGEFADALVKGKAAVEKCPYMGRERYKQNRGNIGELLRRKSGASERWTAEEGIRGVIDKYKADFFLEPLPGEPSCREIIFPFYREAGPFTAGTYIKYRPLGCPIPHFAQIIEADKGLLTIHLTGPCRFGREKEDEQRVMKDERPDKKNEQQYMDIGVCMIGGFIGIMGGGELPAVGATVRFIPSGCMMQKVHSGVVVQAEGDKLHIEGIDLKVWAPPEQNSSQ